MPTTAELNQLIVAAARNTADAYRKRLAVIENDPVESDEVARLRADIDRVSGMADRWEKNPPTEVRLELPAHVQTWNYTMQGGNLVSVEPKPPKQP